MPDQVGHDDLEGLSSPDCYSVDKPCLIGGAQQRKLIGWHLVASVVAEVQLTDMVRYPIRLELGGSMYDEQEEVTRR